MQSCQFGNFWFLRVTTYLLLEYTNDPTTAEATSKHEIATSNKDGKTVRINLSHSNGYAKGGYLI